MQKVLLFLIITLFTFNHNIFSQKKVKEIKLTNINGSAIGRNNETIEQTTQRAVNESKAEAMKQAGVEESIASFSDYFQSEEKGEYEELFTSDVLSDIRGAVKEVEVKNVKKTFDQFDNLKVEVTIDCIVVKYLTEKDVTFDAWVDGVGMFYPNDTGLKFMLKPSKNAFVKVFIFTESDAFQLFPNDYEPSYQMLADKQYFFPSETMDYTLYTDKKSEIHRMIMVFMKEDIPYTGDIKYKPIIDWVFSIPPDMRVIKSFGFSVVNEDKMKAD